MILSSPTSIRLRFIPALVLALALAVTPLSGQDAPAGPNTFLLSTAPTESVAREIVDPSTGARWLLSRDASCSACPGRLVLATSADSPRAASFLERNPVAGSLLPLLRAGDLLIVERHSDRVDLRLQAVALGPARLGGFLRVRLKLNGGVVGALVTGPGRAVIATDAEIRP